MYEKQCIPVGCVPPACCPYLPACTAPEGCTCPRQGGQDTGKTLNSVLTFSRQGKNREFCFDTGKNFETQGKMTVIIKIKSMFIF